jgi:hypothetical protein
MYFSPLFIDEVRDAVLSQLLEHGLGAEELKVVREALEVSIEFIKREKSAGTDTEGMLKSIERENYKLFKKALYGYLKKDAPAEKVGKKDHLCVHHFNTYQSGFNN